MASAGDIAGTLSHDQGRLSTSKGNAAKNVGASETHLRSGWTEVDVVMRHVVEHRRHRVPGPPPRSHPHTSFLVPVHPHAFPRAHDDPLALVHMPSVLDVGARNDALQLTQLLLHTLARAHLAPRLRVRRLVWREQHVDGAVLGEREHPEEHARCQHTRAEHPVSGRHCHILPAGPDQRSVAHQIGEQEA
eukprot:1069495-Rhodomonas_salina.1